MTDFTGESIESKIYVLRRLLNELGRVQKPKVESMNSTFMSAEDLKEAMKNANITFENGSNENENKNETDNVNENTEAKADDGKEEKREENPEL